MTEYATEPETYRPSLERRLKSGDWMDGHDRRQTERNGDGWPRHRARRRNRNRRSKRHD